MNTAWVSNLTGPVRQRLNDCMSTKDDVQHLVNAKWSWMKANGYQAQGFTKEDALISVLELLDCNGIFIDPSKEEYKEWCKDKSVKTPKSNNRVVKILVNRDHMTIQEAIDLVQEVRGMIEDAVADGDYGEAEDIMYSELGLEMDYIFDVLGY